MSAFIVIAGLAFGCYLVWALRSGVLHTFIGGSGEGFSTIERRSRAYFLIRRSDKPELFWAVWLGAAICTVVVVLLGLSGAMG
jgi:hypothetical protein